MIMLQNQCFIGDQTIAGASVAYYLFKLYQHITPLLVLVYLH